MKINLSLKINKKVLLYFLCALLILRPTNPALQVIFGASLGELFNVIMKFGDYLLITCIISFALMEKLAGSKRIFTKQAWLAYCFLCVLLISTIHYGNINNFLDYYAYLGNVFCCIYLFQSARRDSNKFKAFLKGISIFFTIAMLLNSLCIYLFYPNGMYITGEGIVDNNNYYLFGLDNVGFIISLSSFAITATYDLITNKKIKIKTILIYIFIFLAYFYCQAATAILVSLVLFITLILQRLGLLKKVNFCVTLIICLISFLVIIGIQNFTFFSGLFTMLGKNMLLGGRLRIWKASLSSWLDNFWLGIGIDTTVSSNVLYHHGFITAGWGKTIGHAHNIVFEILLKSGIIGTFFFISQFLVCIKGMMARRKSKIAKLLSILFLLFWTTSLLDYRIEQIGGWIIFMLLYDVERLDDLYQQ